MNHVSSGNAAVNSAETSSGLAPTSVPADTTSDMVSSLRRQMRTWEGNTPPQHYTRISSGCAALDDHLPAKGFLAGQLVEWIADGPATTQSDDGAGLLAMAAARNALTGGRALVVVDRAGWFYPPAVAAWGIDLRQLIVLRPKNSADELWALDQALRCPAVAAVWVDLPKLSARDFRRLQLAAEKGGCLGLLMRPQCVLGQPSWSDIQLLIQPQPSSDHPPGVTESTQSKPFMPPQRRRWLVTIKRCRGGTTGQVVAVEMDETTGEMRNWKRQGPSMSNEKLLMANY